MSALSSRPLRALMIALPVLAGAFALVTAVRDRHQPALAEVVEPARRG